MRKGAGKFCQILAISRKGAYNKEKAYYGVSHGVLEDERKWKKGKWKSVL